ncbi:MAG TPA: SUMF1/EgtB/PvdO family nonheme iron enzyme [Planctomycetaceae bacterium]|jgi:formylglycine-generating enzyme required for sulfatase activity|nr:SUMF1/EgtB/PvdO family nonheme iron enzyme [Planctomycetaceae bacterium]
MIPDLFWKLPSSVICFAAVICSLASAGDAPPRKVSASRFAGAKAGAVRDDNGLKMKLVWCPPGQFTMRSRYDCRRTIFEGNRINVTLTAGFWLGQCEVTQSEWKQILHTTPWSRNSLAKQGDDYPASCLIWAEAMDFCQKLSEEERRVGRLPAEWLYTLPTEAQWEYACRAGTGTRFSFETSLDEPVNEMIKLLVPLGSQFVRASERHKLAQYAWFGARFRPQTIDECHAQPVGEKRPNPWGLHDMHGNVDELCREAYTDRLPGGDDPEGPARGSFHVLRGGHWASHAEDCGSAVRNFGNDSREAYHGFRVAVVPMASLLNKQEETIAVGMRLQPALELLRKRGIVVAKTRLALRRRGKLVMQVSPSKRFGTTDALFIVGAPVAGEKTASITELFWWEDWVNDSKRKKRDQRPCQTNVQKVSLRELK